LINSYTNMINVTHVFILLYLYACHDNALYFEYFSFGLDLKKNLMRWTGVLKLFHRLTTKLNITISTYIHFYSDRNLKLCRWQRK
jgi:hypothetical protein